MTSQNKKQCRLFGGSSEVNNSYRFHSIAQDTKIIQFTSHTYFIQAEMFLKTSLFDEEFFQHFACKALQGKEYKKKKKIHSLWPVLKQCKNYLEC